MPLASITNISLAMLIMENELGFKCIKIHKLGIQMGEKDFISAFFWELWEKYSRQKTGCEDDESFIPMLFQIQ